MDSYATLDIFVADPKAGVRAVIKKISLFLAADMKDSLKENVIKILNNQKDNYYPDVGGILLGYSNVKIAKDTEWDYQNDFLSVYIRAKFYIFQPTIGSELRCVVEEVCSSKRTLKCLAHGKFEVNVNIQGEAAKNVVKGELITAKILRVSLRADLPIFLFGDYISNHDPVVQIVDLLDDDSSDEQSNQTQMPPVQVSNNKRSHEQEVKSNHSSLVKKKQKEDTGSMQQAPAGPSSEATPKSPLLDTPSSYLSTLSPTSRNDSNSPSPKKKPLSFLSEQVTQSSSTTADCQQPKKVRLSSDSPSKKMGKEPEPAANKRPKKTLTSDSNKSPSPGKNSSKTELSDASSVSVVSNATSTSEVSLKSKNKKLEPPEGFQMLSRTKSGKVRLQAPDGKILLSYRAAWDHYYSLKENDEKKKSTKVLEGESVAKGKDKEGKADNSSNTSSSTKDTSKIVESKSSESSNEASSSQPKTSTQKKSNITIENASNEKESANKRTPNDPRGKENDMNSIRAVFSTEESDSSFENTPAPDLEKLGILKPKKDDSSSSESDSSESDTVDDKGVQSSKKKALTKKSPPREESSSDDSDDDNDPPPLKRKSAEEKDKKSLKSKSAPTQKTKESAKEKAKVVPLKPKYADESSSSDDSDNDDLPPLNGKPHKKKDLPKVSNTEPISKSNDVNKEAGTKKSNEETSSKPVNSRKNGNVNESSDFGDDSIAKSVTAGKDNSRPSTSIKEIPSSNSKGSNQKASGDESDSDSSSGSSIEDGNLSQANERNGNVAKSLSSSSSKPSSSKALSSKDDKVSNANKPTKELQSKPTNKENKKNLQNESESTSSSSEDESESESDTASDMSSYTVSKKPLKSKISKSKVNSKEDDGLKSPIKKDKNKIEATAKIFNKSIENEDTKNKKSEDLKDKNNDLKDSGSKVKTPKKVENRATSNLKTPKKDKSPSKAQSPMVKWLNGHDNAKNKKPDNVENKKSPHLSSTVMTDKNNKPQVQLPDGISPILKTKRKSTSMANTSLPYYDQIMKGKVEEKALYSKDKSNKNEEKKPTSHNENKEKNKKKNKAKTAGFL